MKIDVVGRGERRVKDAVEVKKWKVASSMKVGASGSRSSSGLDGFLGVCKEGVGRPREKLDNASPRAGWLGIVPACVFRVIEVLKPVCFSTAIWMITGMTYQKHIGKVAPDLGLPPFH